MEIINNEKDLRDYMNRAVKASPEHPVLVDSYLQGRECEVDAICDGTEVLLPGIMEHIERAGVHSGDSMAVYPPQTFSQEIIDTIVDYTKRLAIGLNCIGMMNIQFVIFEEQVYVIEVNPRASRTVPFLSKVTNIPMAQLATQMILGKNLKDLGYTEGLAETPDMVHVKAPVFSFTKLAKVDSLLGPEMKSTGEAMGSDVTLEKALYKSFEAAKLHMADYGSVLFTVADEDKEETLALAKDFAEIGYSLVATQGTAAFFKENGLYVREVEKLAGGEDEEGTLVEDIRHGRVQAVVNTMGNTRASLTTATDGFRIRQEAISRGIPLFTSLDTVAAILKVMQSRSFTTKNI